MFLNNTATQARIAWAMVEDVPPLLGRIDVFSKFRILFDEANEEIKFQHIDSGAGPVK